MNLQDFWNLDDAELFEALIPESAYRAGDHYANSWLLGMARLILAFPFLSDDDRQLIQDARLTVAELRIMQEQVEKCVGAQERQELLASLEVLESDYAKSMAALEPLFQGDRLTESQAALLQSELAVRTETLSEDSAEPRSLKR